MRDTGVRGFAAVACCVIATAWAAHAQPAPAVQGLRADPPTVTFHSTDDIVKVTIYRGASPVPASEIGKPSLWVDQNQYTHMIHTSTVDPGLLVIVANKEDWTGLQVGTYSLKVPVGKDTLSIPLNAPLDQEKSIIDREVARQGKDPQQVKQELGMADAAPRTRLTVSLPSQYHEGDTLEITLPGDGDADYYWTVNGETVAQGKGQATFRYPFPAPGEGTIGVTEKKAGATVAEWTGATTVLPEPEIAWSVKARTQVAVPAPKGYRKYDWSLDGTAVSREDTLVHTFQKPGTYRVEVYATDPAEPGLRPRRHVVWRTTVE